VNITAIQSIVIGSRGKAIYDGILFQRNRHSCEFFTIDYAKALSYLLISIEKNFVD